MSALPDGTPIDVATFLGGRTIGELATKMGIVFYELTPERSVATMPVEGNRQSAHILHGGAHLVLGETLGSIAANLHAGEGRIAMGIEISASHSRSIARGTVVGVCTAISLGRTLTTHEITVSDDRGRRLSTVRITNFLSDRRD